MLATWLFMACCMPMALQAQTTSQTENDDAPTPFGEYAPGKGFTVARTDIGELDISLLTYVRYLNQGGLDDTYVDHFGNIQSFKKRHDFQVNKVMIYFKGWFLDPRFRYHYYVWSTNTALGNTSNNLVAGVLSYQFNEAFNLGAGVVRLPTNRSLSGTFPLWHRTDTRMIADEFMRGGYTQGLAADGRITRKLNYAVAMGNNLNNFGVDASKLDNKIKTVSGALIWMPSTGEFGPANAVGDFEHHEKLATLFGLHATFSNEDKQSQPGVDTPGNTQIRLSDGTTVFTPDALAPGVSVDQVDYTMFALNAGMKYKGYALEGEAYYRVLDNFKATGPVGVDKLIDKGVQIKASSMLMPKTLQLYLNGSKIFGEYGDPWDAAMGLNWWPFKKRGIRVNPELMYVRKSPVGYNSLPYQVGANGWIFVTNLELGF